MSVIEKSVQLGKDLFEINRKTTQEMIAIQMGGVRRFIETNVDALRNVGDIRDFSQFAEAQKSYSSTLLSGAQSDFIAGRDLVKDAFEDTRAAFSAVSTEAPKKTTRKPRATAAKKAAK